MKGYRGWREAVSSVVSAAQYETSSRHPHENNRPKSRANGSRAEPTGKSGGNKAAKEATERTWMFSINLWTQLKMTQANDLIFGGPTYGTLTEVRDGTGETIRKICSGVIPVLTRKATPSTGLAGAKQWDIPDDGVVARHDIRNG